MHGTVAVTQSKLYCLQDPAFRKFLHDISSPAPVCAYVPPSVWPVLERTHNQSSLFFSNLPESIAFQVFPIICYDLLLLEAMFIQQLLAM